MEDGEEMAVDGPEEATAAVPLASSAEMASQNETDGVMHPVASIMSRGRRQIHDFLRDFSCGALLPKSSKVCVLNEMLPARFAFSALVEQGACCLPLLYDPCVELLTESRRAKCAIVGSAFVLVCGVDYRY